MRLRYLAFAADFSNADTAAKAKAEIKAFAASYGITTIDNTVNSLTADQLQVIYNNMDALKATAASANATIKGTTDVAVATKAANDAVATMNSLLPAGVSISAPTIDTVTPAVAAELESRPINSDGPNDAAIMFHVLSNAVP